jgi:cbb3-type cytochrome oxidase subunit 1
MVLGSMLVVSLFYWICEKATGRPLVSFLLTIPLALVIMTFVSAQAHAVGGTLDYWSQLPNSLLSVMIASILYLLGIWKRLT